MSCKKTTEIDRHIGNRLREKRIEMEVGQWAVSEAIDISPQQLGKYERAVDRVSASTLYRIAQFIGVPVTAFYEGLGAVSRAD